MAIYKIMYITFIEFNDLQLDFSSNYFQGINFIYQGKRYDFKLYLKANGDFYIYDSEFIAAQVLVNKIIRTTTIDLIFCQENLTDNKDLNLTTIFNKYQLGVVSYV